MKPKSVKCEFCKAEMSPEPCQLANHKAVIDGKEHFFCCSVCAQKGKQKRKA